MGCDLRNRANAVLTGHTDSVVGVAVTEINGRPHAITTGYDRTIWVWELPFGTKRACPH